MAVFDLTSYKKKKKNLSLSELELVTYFHMWHWSTKEFEFTVHVDAQLNPQKPKWLFWNTWERLIALLNNLGDHLHATKGSSNLLTEPTGLFLPSHIFCHSWPLISCLSHLLIVRILKKLFLCLIPSSFSTFLAWEEPGNMSSP
jgi:hypothetical protein